MTDHAEALKSLHTALVDSRNGYEEALEDAEGKGLTPLFREMIALRTEHADALEQHLRAMGQPVDAKGSFMSSVHRAVISIRSVITGLDESVLPGLIDGEERIVGYYDEAIEESPSASPEHGTLVKQRDVVRQKIAEMKERRDRAA
jgi:uncharacterized protein (TIGR02284 family)